MKIHRRLFVSILFCVLSALTFGVITYVLVTLPVTAISIPFAKPKPILQTGSILFVSNTTGNNDIYSMDVATKKITNLTHTPGEDMNPQLSPDGTQIVFYSDRTKNAQIYSLNLKTKITTRLTNDTADDYDPTYSPDGTFITFKSTRDDNKGDIFLMTADGQDQTNITPLRTTTEEWDPNFSPDGKKIIFVSRMKTTDLSDEIFTMYIDGSHQTRLTNNQLPDWYASLSTKSGTVLFTSKDKADAGDAIYSMFDSGHHRVKLTNLPGNSDDPAWNAREDKIIFLNQKNDDAPYDIYMMDSNGKNLKKILSNGSSNLSPIFIPDKQ